MSVIDIKERGPQTQAELEVAWWYLYVQRGAMSEAGINSEHFIAVPQLSEIWEVCRQAVVNGQEIDILMMSRPYHKIFEALGDMHPVLSPSLVRQRERAMREGAAIERVEYETVDWIEAKRSGELQAAELHARFQEIATEFEIGEDIDSRPHADVVKEAIDGYFEEDDDRGIAVPVFGETLTPYKYGKLYLVGGLTSNHKTTFALQSAEAAAKSEHPALYWTLEDSDLDMGERLIVARSDRLTLDHFERGAKARGDAESHAEAIEMRDVISQTSLIRHLDKKFPMTRMLAVISRQVQKHKLRMVVIDFMQLIAKDDPRMLDVEHQTLVVQTLADLAKRLNIVLLAVVQLTQEATKRAEDGIPPRLGDVRGGSAITQAAYGVIMTNTPIIDKSLILPTLPRHERRIELVVRKWKRGRRVVLNCIVDASHDRIYRDNTRT